MQDINDIADEYLNKESLQIEFIELTSKDELGQMSKLLNDNIKKAQKDIEEEFNIRRSTATGILNSLEKNDMLKRESVSYDKRLKKLVLTEKSNLFCKKIRETLIADEKKLTENLTAEEIEFFLKIIAEMMKNIMY